MLGRAAFVTGAAQGLGKAFSEALLQRGAKVFITDVQAKKGLLVQTEFQNKYGKDNCMFMYCDVTSQSSLNESFHAAVKKFGHIDLMVNNAGIADESRIEDTLNINLLSVIRGSNLGVEHMRKDRGGRGGVVINVASTAGLVGVFYTPTYCASKFGVVGYHLSSAGNPHLIDMGVQFGCLCPAFTDTAILDIDESKVTTNLDDAKRIVEQVGINKVETVVEGFLKLVESEDCNGDIVTVIPGDGVKYKRKGKDKWGKSRL